MALVEFDIIFDFTGDYQLKVALTNVTGVPLESVTARVEVTHPNGIAYEGSSSNDDIIYDPASSQFTVFTTPVYQMANGEPYEGVYEVKVVVYSNGTYYSAAERSYHLLYDPVEVDVFADFDVFTPQLLLFDNTASYEKAGFTATIAKTWHVDASAIGATWDVTNSDAVDLQWNGSYYDTSYDVSFVVDVTYVDNTYTWCSIVDKFTYEDTLHAYTPPKLSELLTQITDYKRKSDDYLGKNNILYNSTKKRYDHMWAVFHHLVDRICGGSSSYSSEMNTYIEEILTNLADGNMVTRTHTNAIINPFDPEGFCDSGGVGSGGDKHYAYIQAIPATIWNIAHMLNKKPSVLVLNDLNERMEPELIEYLDDNNIRLTFLDAVTGKAYLN